MESTKKRMKMVNGTIEEARSIVKINIKLKGSFGKVLIWIDLGDRLLRGEQDGSKAE